MPHEIQSLHWQQNQVSVFPVVILMKQNGKIREDHIVVISNNLKHDPAFVELSNRKIHQYYEENGFTIVKDIEINDGCSTQFRSIKVFTEFAKRKIETARIYLETSHGKSKSDGLGGVVKSYVSSAVSSSEVIIRDAQRIV